METKYCAYSVLAPKGKRKNARRSCKKTSNSAENSDLCEVLNKRCGLKENHDRRLTDRTNSKRVSPKKRVKSVQPKPAPRKVAQRQAVVEELPVAPRKVAQRQAVVEELPVVSTKSQDKENYDAIVNELRKQGSSQIYYTGDYERFLGDKNEEEKQMFEYKKGLFQQIRKNYGTDIIDIKFNRNMNGSMYNDVNVISVNPGMMEKFNSMV